MSPFWVVLLVLSTAAVNNQQQVCEAAASTTSPVGVCYGQLGNNLPTPNKAVDVLRKYGISKIRLFDFNESMYQSLSATGISVALTMENNVLLEAQNNETVVKEWLTSNVFSRSGMNINYIVVGDNAIQGISSAILPVMQTVRRMLDTQFLGRIKVTTSFPHRAAFDTYYPPSTAVFIGSAIEDITGILKFLSTQGAPLMVSLYPYLEYVRNRSMDLDYVLFRAKKPVLVDRSGRDNYFNLFDAMVDAFYYAMEKQGVLDVGVIIGETGWPTAGRNGNITTPQMAATYNNNLLKHLEKRKGTPRRREFIIEGYIYSLFDEDLKPLGGSQYFGIFQLNQEPKYPLFTLNS